MALKEVAPNPEEGTGLSGWQAKKTTPYQDKEDSAQSQETTQTFGSKGIELFNAGFNTLPIIPSEKAPSIHDWRRLDITEGLVQEWATNGFAKYGVGIRCGATCHGIDCDILDADVASKIREWIEQNLSDGRQLAYRIGQPPKFLIPAKIDGIEKKMVSDVFIDGDGNRNQIEILADGQQFVAFGIHKGTGNPYEWFGGTPQDIGAEGLQNIARDDVLMLFDFFDELATEKGWQKVERKDKPRNLQYTRPDPESTRPGDIFNREKTPEFREMIEKAGWQYVYSTDGNDFYRRPGKADGHSASWNGNTFYVFTSSDPNFEGETGYDMFGVYSRLYHGGDASAAAKALAEFPTTCKTDSIDAWPDPSELITRQPADPYPLEALPGVIGDAVKEIVDFVQCPAALAACSSLAVVSTVAQGLYDVRRAEKLQGPTSLYFLVVADSGERKSTADDFSKKPLAQWEAEQAELLAPELKEHTAKHKSWEAKQGGLTTAIKEAAKKGKDTESLQNDLITLEREKPEPPKIPRLLFSDSTPEALTYSLAHKYPIGGFLSSEAGIVFGGHAMGKESVMRNLAVLNSIWGGESFQVERRTAPSYMLKGARLSMGLAVQPETLRNFIESSNGLARGSGFLARFLIACPDSTQGTRKFKEPPKTWPKLAVYHRRISALLDIPLRYSEHGELIPQLLDLSSEAKATWIDFHDEVEAELQDGRDMAETRDVASKAADNVARLAALFHVFENDVQGPVDLQSMEAAIAIVTWHLYEARRFIGEISLPTDKHNAIKLDAWLLEYCKKYKVEGERTRIIQQFGPNCVRKKTDFKAALEELEDAGRIIQKKDGRQKLIKVNPKLLGG